MFLVNPYIYSTTAWENLTSIRFDGVNDYVTAATATELSNTQNFSLSMWVYNPKSEIRILLNQTVDGNNRIQLNFSSTGGLHLRAYIGNGTIASNKTATGLFSSISAWTHFTVVYDGTLTGDTNRLKIFVDGVNSTSVDIAGIPSTSPTFTTEAFEIGGSTFYSSYSKSLQQDISIFDYSLTSGEVTTIYNSNCANDITSLAPVHWYRPTFSTYPTINDIGSNPQNGTMTNQSATDLFKYGTCGDFYNNRSTRFGGVDEYLTASTVTELSNVSAFSMSFWVYNPSSASKVLLNQTVDGSNRVQCNISTSGGLHFQAYIGNGAISGNKTGTGLFSTTDGWHHFAVVYDGGLTGDTNRLKIFVDGTSSTIANVAGVPATSPTFTSEAFEIGGSTFYSSYTDCGVDEFRIYDYALTSGNVTSIYNNKATKIDDLSTLAVHNWKMGDDSTYPTIDDIGTGTARDLTCTNMESGDIDDPNIPY